MAAGLLVFSILLTGCGASRSLRQYAREGRCESAAERLGDVRLRSELSQVVKSAGGDVASYSLIGLAGAADIVLLHAPGIVVAGLVCSPGLLIDIPLAKATDGASMSESIWARCAAELGGRISEEIGFPIGEAASEVSKDWGGMDFDPVSAAMRMVAECHLASGDKDGVLKAERQARVIREAYYPDLSPDERRRVDGLSRRIENHRSRSIE